MSKSVLVLSAGLRKDGNSDLPAEAFARRGTREMSGQMKTLLDRTNPLFPVDYAFRDIYLPATADEAESAMDGAIR